MSRQILSYDQKHFIVTHLARRRTPSEVAEGLAKEFGLTIPRQSIEKYDPTKRNGKLLSAKWRDVFYRERVLTDMAREKLTRVDESRAGTLQKLAEMSHGQEVAAIRSI